MSVANPEIALSSFEVQYMNLFFKFQRGQWENYEAGANHDLNPLDRAIYDVVLHHKESVFPEGRKGKVAREIISRSLVDKHPDVASLRNRLDEWDNYLTGPLEEVAADPTQRRIALAGAMKPDVLSLMSLRNQLARELGYQSYVALVMNTDELDLNQVVNLVKGYLSNNLPRARQLSQKLELTWAGWFSQLDAYGDCSSNLGLEETLRKLSGFVGLTGALGNITLFDNGPFAGYVGAVSVPGDVRLMVKGKNSLGGLRTLCHELGHALGHSLNRKDGLFKTWTAANDECNAVVMEFIGVEALFSPKEQERLRDIALLENVRVSLSFMFELDLWQTPEKAEELYLHWHGQLDLPDCNPQIWSLDSFRSIDPVYIHNYVLGAIYADRVLSFLKQQFGQNYSEWGSWINHNLYQPGRSRSLADKLAAAIDG